MVVVVVVVVVVYPFFFPDGKSIRLNFRKYWMVLLLPLRSLGKEIISNNDT